MGFDAGFEDSLLEGTYDQTSGVRKPTTLSEFKIEADHFSLVKRTAFHLKSRVPPNVDLDDLIQAGLEGLVQANKSYDSTKNVTFEGFAKVRIKGAMLDEVRRLSYATRTTVSLKREQSEAIEHLANLKGREPTSAEVAGYLGKDLESYEKERLIAQGSETLSSDSNQGIIGEDIDESSNPEDQVDRDETLSILQALIAELPERTQLVLNLYYVEELNLKEIAAVLSISEGRVSQILSETASKLRKKFDR